MDEADDLQGRCDALTAAVVALLIEASLARKQFTGEPREAAQEAILRRMEEQLPGVLAVLEAGGSAARSRGYERQTEFIAALVRQAIVRKPP